MELHSARIEIPKRDWMLFKSNCALSGAKTMVSVIIKLIRLFNKYGDQVFDIDNHTYK